MKNILAIIPARGGSKGIPRKNIRSFAGYPLIAWSIAAEMQSSLVTRVIVSTDDEEIAAAARRIQKFQTGELGVKCLQVLRPAFDGLADFAEFGVQFVEKQRADGGIVREQPDVRSLDMFVESFLDDLCPLAVDALRQEAEDHPAFWTGILVYWHRQLAQCLRLVRYHEHLPPT